MKLFLDTSSLFKLYHKEADTSVIASIFNAHSLTTVFLSELSKIEFSSIVWKKVRIREMHDSKAKEIIGHFELDLQKFTFIPIDNIIIEQAKNLIGKYGVSGLRTLDSLQLSTAVYLKNYADLFITFDKLLDSFFKQESLPNEKSV